MSLDPHLLGRTLQAHLGRTGLALAFHDRATGRTHDLHRMPQLASRTGFCRCSS